MAADPEVFGGVRSYYDEYVCDVSLLGQLYKSEYSDLCGGLSMYNRGYLEGIIAAQSQISGGFIIDEMLDEKLVNNINLDFSKAGDGVFNASRRELSYTLAKEVTGRQRFTALALLQDRCNVNVYSKDVDKRLEKLISVDMQIIIHRCRIYSGRAVLILMYPCVLFRQEFR